VEENCQPREKKRNRFLENGAATDGNSFWLRDHQTKTFSAGVLGHALVANGFGRFADRLSRSTTDPACF